MYIGGMGGENEPYNKLRTGDVGQVLIARGGVGTALGRVGEGGEALCSLMVGCLVVREDDEW